MNLELIWIRINDSCDKSYLNFFCLQGASTETGIIGVDRYPPRIVTSSITETIVVINAVS